MTEQQNTRRSFAGTAVLMGIIILAAKILGLVRDMLAGCGALELPQERDRSDPRRHFSRGKARICRLQPQLR